ncbi:hypothetical protein Taro_005905, partial [Colocasia esculenta]|nr:hypothetical protein [Colocasia esculenta]
MPSSTTSSATTSSTPTATRGDSSARRRLWSSPPPGHGSLDLLLRLTFDNICGLAFGKDPETLAPGLPENSFATTRRRRKAAVSGVLVKEGPGLAGAGAGAGAVLALRMAGGSCAAGGQHLEVGVQVVGAVVGGPQPYLLGHLHLHQLAGLRFHLGCRGRG